MTGACQQRVPSGFPPYCTNGAFQYRSLLSSYLKADGSGSPFGSIFPNPPNSNIQDMSTIGPVHTVSTGASYSTSVAGPHVITSTTNASSTSCSITPSFAQNVAITVNAVACEPNFWADNSHLAVPPAPSKVKVYLPSGMAALATTLDNAITDWNLGIATTSLELERVTTACGNGPDCITVVAENVPNGVGGYYCGYAKWDPPDLVTGEHTGGLLLKIATNWSSFNTAERRRTFAHELGHFLGMDNLTGCAGNSAVLNPDFSCAASSSPLTTPTATDYVPIVSSVYGGHTKKPCGF